jgi:LuxR family maltose regulon positive regulatory protein
MDKSKTESRIKRYMEALILSSLALKKSGRTEDGLSMLGQAVNLSAPEGYSRIFLDEGDELTEMLNELLQNSNTYGLENNVNYLKDLLKNDKPVLKKDKAGKNNIDSLTKRELEVLLQVSKGLSNNEISEKLCISPATVKSHIHKVLSKLNVDNRNKAVLEAKKLGCFRNK